MLTPRGTSGGFSRQVAHLVGLAGKTYQISGATEQLITWSGQEAHQMSSACINLEGRWRMKVKMTIGTEVDMNKVKLVCKLKGVRWGTECGNGNSETWEWISGSG